jgi:1-deoxy-D-xylulose-5-phosphate reductoisomerase
MMNKGLEIIEARWLFDIPAEKIDVLIHPQSIVHSMVEYIDGAVVAQMAVPDMRGPIVYALSYPDRAESGINVLDLAGVQKLEFFKPDPDTFRCLKLAYHAAREGGSLPCTMNAANEVAVDAFLKKKIGFLDIPRIVEAVMNKYPARPLDRLEDVFEIDKTARVQAGELLSS